MPASCAAASTACAAEMGVAGRDTVPTVRPATADEVTDATLPSRTPTVVRPPSTKGRPPAVCSKLTTCAGEDGSTESSARLSASTSAGESPSRSLWARRNARAASAGVPGRSCASQPPERTSEPIVPKWL